MPERLATRAPRLLRWLSLAAAVTALDQWSKALAESLLDYGQPVAVLPVLNFTLHYNTGAAFSLLSEAGGPQRWLLSGVAALVSLGLAVWLATLPARERLLGAALALILGGALGNLWDRLSLGHVVDFVSLHCAGHYFPTFNLADAAITLGAIALLLDAWRQPGKAGVAGPRRGSAP